MRRIYRTEVEIPAVLLGAGVSKAKAELTAYYQLPDIDRQRTRPPLEPELWLDSTVRRALTDLFRSKCAYCEVLLDVKRYSQVDHYRPFSAASDDVKRTRRRYSDYYSWFAYEWRNLFSACLECSRYKGNLFPVDGPRAPWRSSWDEADAKEHALLINPCQDEPHRHLEFLMNGRVRGKDEIGGATVDTLSLNRASLLDLRRLKFDTCLRVLDMTEDAVILDGLLRNELSDDAPHSGSARLFLFEIISRYAQISGDPKPKIATLEDSLLDLIPRLDDSKWKISLAGPELSQQPIEYFSSLADSSLLQSAESASEYDFHDPALQRLRESSQLTRISIKNFKGIKSLVLDIPRSSEQKNDAPCLMLLGENSTGKSTTLQALALALMGDRLREKLKLKVEDFIPRDPMGWYLNDSLTPEVQLDFDVGEPIHLILDPLSKRFVGGGEAHVTVLAFGARRFFGSDVARRNPVNSVKSLFDPFAKIQNPNNWLQNLKTNQFDAVARAMRAVLVLSDEDRIGRDDDGRFFVHAHGRETPLDQLSDGYRSLMAMVLDVMRGMIAAWGNLEQARGIVLVDEIETHLHPRWKLRVIDALRKAMPLVQFIASTHDPLCLRGMRKDEVQVLVRNEDYEIYALEGLPDVRGLRAEQLLTSDYFGLSSTADPSIDIALNVLAEANPISAAKSIELAKETLLPFKWLGDSPKEQVINEAVRRYLEESPTHLSLDREKVREDAVAEVLNELRAFRRNLN